MAWEDKHTKIVLYLDHALLEGVKAAMALKSRSKSAIISEAVRQYLEKMKGEAK